MGFSLAAMLLHPHHQPGPERREDLPEKMASKGRAVSTPRPPARPLHCTAGLPLTALQGSHEGATQGQGQGNSRQGAPRGTEALGLHLFSKAEAFMSALPPFTAYLKERARPEVPRSGCPW